VQTHSSLLWLWLTVVLFAAGGASCPYARVATPPEPLPPAAFQQTPTLAEVIAAVNRNTSAARQLKSDTVTLRIDGTDMLTKAIPPLRGNLAWEAPLRFRMTASLSSLTGTEVDIGSNDELFWIWSRWIQPPPGHPPAIFFARHSEFEHSPLRHLAPIEPRQIVDALGLTTLPPDAQYEGPTPRGNGLVELRVTTSSPRGPVSRVLLVHEQYGWVEQQHLFDADGQRIASMIGSRHRYYPEQQVVLPLHIEIKLANPEITLVIDVADYELNRLTGDPRQLWSMPQMPGYQALDMARPPEQQLLDLPTSAAGSGYPNLPPPPGMEPLQGAFPPPGSPPTAYSAENTQASRYRGYSTSR
jgi:hypothetical protein